MSAFAAGSGAPLLGSLARASWQGALFIAAVWVLCRLAPRLPARLRCALWWAASLKLLIAFAWPAPLALPLLPAAARPAPEASPAAAATSATALTTAIAVTSGAAGTTVTPGAAATAVTSVIPVTPATPANSGTLGPPQAKSGHPAWATALLAAWAAGLLLQLAWMLGELRRNRALLRASAPLGDLRALELVVALRAEVGLRQPVEVRCSPRVRSPQALGLLRPIVLLPQELGAFSGTELAMALCHELLHLRRRDLWWGWVPLLAERIFFFHPLAALAAREYALAREAACDAEVVRLLAPAPRAYGRLLLKLTLTPAGTGIAGRPAAGALAAAPAVEQLKRRLRMLHESSHAARGSRRLLPLAALLAVAGLVPLEIVAQRADTTPIPAPTLSPEGALHAVPSPAARPVPTWTRTVTAAGRPLRALRPIARAMDALRAGGGEEQDPVLFMSGNSVETLGGGWESIRHVKSLRRKAGGGDLLWFRHGGKEYLVRDAATLERVHEIFAPQAELGRQQGELGAKQGALGAQQNELGSRQGKLGAEQGELGAQQARLGLDRARRALDGEAREEATTEASQGDLERGMQRLAEQQTELGRQQEELGRQQEVLGEQQQKLGRLQEKAAREAQAQLRALIDHSLTAGLAQETR